MNNDGNDRQDMDDTDERRIFSRITYDASATLAQDNQSTEVSLIDLSLKGLLIWEPEDWTMDLGQLFDVRIQLSEEAMIRMRVKWRHSHNRQVGFECDHIDIDSICHLRRLVELNLADESLLDRQLAALGA